MNCDDLKTNQQGFLRNHGWVWFVQQTIANILSSNDVKMHHQVTCDSGKDDVFHGHKEDSIAQFKCGHHGLCCHDIDNEAMTSVDNVKENKKNFTQQQIKQADQAQLPHKMTCHPTMENPIKMIEDHNCPLT